MHRESFYVNQKYVFDNEVIISGDEAHHLSRVLRKKTSDVVWAVDGEGTAYEVQIINISRDEARGKILQKRRRLGEPVADVTLAQGILKGDRFDWLVEKATEIGIRSIIPLLSENTETAATPQKLARWKRVTVAAMKQSGRSILPEITPAKTFDYVLSLASECHHRLIAHPGSGSTPIQLPPQNGPKITPKAIIIVGAEGGFTQEEIEQSRKHGFQSVTLGQRRLRAETAGIVISTLMLFQLGELG
jgi:16S rRNA (uracil1498-N3)-methyltransferase